MVSYCRQGAGVLFYISIEYTRTIMCFNIRNLVLHPSIVLSGSKIEPKKSAVDHRLGINSCYVSRKLKMRKTRF